MQVEKVGIDDLRTRLKMTIRFSRFDLRELTEVNTSSAVPGPGSSSNNAPPSWHLIQSQATAISAADVARTLSAAVNSHLVDPFVTSSGTNQIAVIHPPTSSSLGLPHGVPLALSGMLFDPLAQQNAQHRAISRSAASQFIHGLVPRMQHLLGGHKILQQDSRVTNIVDGLRSSNELRQAEAASELAEWLLMANEDTLPAHLPVRDITHALIQLLLKEHNFELMLTASRCITNLLEAMPRSHPIVIDAVPYLLEKLKRIECIDVAEQSLCALEELSKKNNAKAILTAGGIAACISHVDFFSMSSQRLAFSIASNCALYLTASEFHLVRDSLPELTERLSIEDKRCLESVCLLFYRLVENMKHYPEKLREIAGTNTRLFALVQQLLVTQPNHLSSTTFANLVKMIHTMTKLCPDLAATLIQLDYHSTLKNLFMGTSDGFPGENGDMMERPANQLQDMVALAAELFPKLPTSGIFEIDQVAFPSKNTSLPATWYWADDSGKWNPFKSSDVKLLEHKKSCGASKVELQIGPTMHTVDLEKMVQINCVTHKERPVKREIAHSKLSKDDERLVLLQSDQVLMEKVVSLIFPIVFIEGESSAVSLRLECMRAMLRMICPTPPSLLRVLLFPLPLSSNIASALASPMDKDISTVVAALQMVHILLEKMSDIYGPLFRKEGVAHELAKLASFSTTDAKNLPSTSAVSTSQDTSRVTRSHRVRQAAASSNEEKKKEKEETGNSTNQDEANTPEKEHIAMRTRKRSSPESSNSKKEKEPRRKSSILMHSLRMLKNAAPGSGSGSSPPSSSSPSTSQPTPPAHSTLNSSSAVNSFIAQIVSSGGSSNSSNSRLPFGSSSTISPSSGCVRTTLSQQSIDKIKVWIRKESERILKTYLVDAGSGAVLECLEWIASELNKKDVDVGTAPLTQLYDILKTDDVSAFEMTHSGVISALHEYLTSEGDHIQPPRRLRLRRFVAIFMHLRPDNLRPSGVDGCFEVFSSLISKLLASVAQLEQFQVKVNDMGGIVTGANGCLRGAQALRFFQSHQIKCLLRRHPDCHDLREYHRNGGSTIKVDPFTSISAIEKYLIDKGIHRAHSGEDSSGEEMSDDEEPRRGDNQGINSGNSNQASGSGSNQVGGQETRIEILIGDTSLPSHMSVLQALRQYSNQLEDSSIGNALWMNTHILLYRSTNAPAPPTPQSSQSQTAKEKKHKTNDKVWQEGELASHPSLLWSYLDALPTESGNSLADPSMPSLQLIRALYGLNRHWFALFEDENVLPTTYSPILPPASFHSAKLSSKVTRQLSDFISVATQQIPQWTTDLVNFVPFLFPFSLRRSFIYCTSFGRDRALMHLVSQSEGGHGENSESGRLTHRLEKRKLLVKRDDLLKTSEAALANNASSRVMLEVSFEGEAGTGFGPTLEFYTMVSKELQNAVLNIWHSKETTTETEEGVAKEYVVAPFGLYPQAWSHYVRKDTQRIKKFEMMGRLMGQALVDSRMLDLPLSPIFLHWLSAEKPSHLSLSHLEQLDPHLYTSLRNLSLTDEIEFEFLETYFTMPGDESFELMKGGKNKAVNKQNALQFIKLVSHWRLYEGVNREMEAVRRGFSQVVSPSLLSVFLPEELDELFCGSSDYSEKTWSQSAIAQAIKPDHGYNHDSDQIKWLAQMLSSFGKEQQRNFVQFVTGSPRLPVGGLRALNPPLTVVRKSGGGAHGPVDHELPSAMTCYNYLKVPAYSSYEVFCERFQVALRFIYSFHLT
ncbi:hypothetical protein WR25_23345 isoform F [Diploscapter pachys]|uniref:E3 ubiquitin-protein ligase n=1 Tax=Diploscapter pachys TaxID=2018661 RepID=A0A2A2K259_9BILA|nr:hypothetical protein WR25_23345 isoform D [Diploscapter pachys]PAV67974.1 hypothetical protein WR25_23345 isoform E [Diploscapter pachys]PAV67975.1 hypothetical protein WR25_23345 isoform F [Diploscapter pachys]